jgi:hypothetical protein
VATQRHPDGRRRDIAAQLQQLALDAHVPPPGVLARQAHDQRLEVGRERRPPRPPGPMVPPPVGDLSLPATQRGRVNRQDVPRVGRQAAAQGREQEAIRGPPGRAAGPPPQDAALVAERQQLDLGCGQPRPPRQEQTQEAADDGVEERE